MGFEPTSTIVDQSASVYIAYRTRWHLKPGALTARPSWRDTVVNLRPGLHDILFILLWLTPDDFTRQWETSGRQRVKGQARVSNLFVVSERAYGRSGPRLWAWVQVKLLVKPLFYLENGCVITTFLYFFIIYTYLPYQAVNNLLCAEDIRHQQVSAIVINLVTS